MSLPPEPPAPAFPRFRPAEFLPAFGLGWAAGAALSLVLRALGGALPDPCAGHTLLALAAPLLLGPGGLAFTAANWRRPRRAAVGLGLVLASLLPALAVGAQDIGQLRGRGCAGGYVVFTEGTGAQARSVSSLSLTPGSTQRLTGRIGGYQRATYPEPFLLSAQSSAAGLQVSLPRTRVRAGESFPVIVQVAPGAAVNTYTAGVGARTTHQGKQIVATGTLDITLRRSP
ncbi:hypothetical protein [Deinococcus hohokamensis]|uniref:DUF4131 domain-containing protein n=1 Tax=Deinococcus hohokamensis TaxID=309883 RepID=A0ABV9I8Q9_9DEIO